MRNPTKEILLVGVGILVAGGIVLAQAELTADQILDRMDEASDRVNAGSLIAKVRFDNAYADGTTTYKVFGILARLDGYLIYFLEPEDEKGSIYLVVSSPRRGSGGDRLRGGALWELRREFALLRGDRV